MTRFAERSMWRLVMAMAAIVVVGIAAAVLVNPRGEFPLNDDWLYAREVEQFLTTGRIVKPQLAAVSLILQTLWGAAASTLFGFSHTTLRLSGVMLHLLAALLTAMAVGRRAPPGHATLAGFVVLLSPLGFVSAFSFMPEPLLEATMALTVVAVILWDEGQTVWRGSLLTLAAAGTYLVHPVAILVPLWLLVRTLVRPQRQASSPPGYRRARPYLRAVPALVALGGTIPFLIWYLGASTPGTMSGMWIARSGGIDVPLRALSRLATVLPYLGLSLLPLGLALFSWRRTLLPTCFVLWAWGQAWWLGAVPPLPLPSLENVLHRGGLGFAGLQGTPQVLPSWFWMVISLACLVSSLGLLGHWISPSRLWAPMGVMLAVVPWIGGLVVGESLLRGAMTGIIGFMVWVWAFRGVVRERGMTSLAMLWLGVLLALPPFYDRYLVALMPLLVVDVVPHLQRIRTKAWTSLVVMGALSVIGTHDYMAWNRVRWEQIRVLEQRGVAPDEIDGGYEWAGWRHAWEGASGSMARASDSPWWIRLWAPQIVPRYVVALSPIPGHGVESTTVCRTIVPGWRIYVHRSRAPHHPGADPHPPPPGSDTAAHSSTEASGYD